MARRLIHLAAVSLVVTVASAAFSGATLAGQQRTTVSCGRPITLLFWPRGNADLSKLGQPKITVAHLDIYRSFAPTYPLERFLAWAAAGKFPPNTPSPYVNPYCISYTTPSKLAAIASPVRLTTAARVLCSPSREVVITIDELGDFRYRVRVIAKPNLLVVDALVAPKGSWLTYAGKSCTKKTPPA